MASLHAAAGIRDLIDLLGRYRPSVAEIDALAAMRQLAGRPTAEGTPHSGPFDSGRFDPGHITASAFVTDRRLDRLLLVHHRKLGIWVQPGGHIEPGDPSLLAAAVREVAEETGLAARADGPLAGEVFDLDVHRIPPHGSVPAHLHFDVRFHLVALGREPEITAEVIDVAWFDLDGVGGVVGDESVRRGVDKLLRLRGSVSPDNRLSPSGEA